MDEEDKAQGCPCTIGAGLVVTGPSISREMTGVAVLCSGQKRCISMLDMMTFELTCVVLMSRRLLCGVKAAMIAVIDVFQENAIQ